MDNVILGGLVAEMFTNHRSRHNVALEASLVRIILPTPHKKPDITKISFAIKLVFEKIVQFRPEFGTLGVYEKRLTSSLGKYIVFLGCKCSV